MYTRRHPFMIVLTLLLWLGARACGCGLGICLDGCGCEPVPKTAAVEGSCCSGTAGEAESASTCACGLKAAEAEIATVFSEGVPGPSVESGAAVQVFDDRVVFFRGSENRWTRFPNFGKPPGSPGRAFLQMWRC